ncbi:MAG: 3-oxo-tetronate kinase, partial [Pseudomonadota bacterium]
MKLGIIADDFTGASDIGLTLAEAGMTVAQFIGVPNAPADPDLNAGVVALKTRTAPVDDAIKTSLAACDWLRAQGVEQIVLKVCSTFDSTVDGNIGPVLDALAQRLSAGPVIVCPAFPENGRSVYQGHLFVADRLLNESGMQDHPLTPMKDADLRRVLAAQSTRDIGHIPALTVLQGPDAIKAAFDQDAHMITDAITDADLLAIGQAAKGAPLLCGGSGIALGLPANFGVQAAAPSWAPVTGPGAVFSGSCSIATRGQVETYAANAPTYQIDADRAVAGGYDIAQVADWVMAQDVAPLVYSSADPAVVKAAQDA